MKHVFLLVLALFLYVGVFATHIVGGSLTYEHLGGATYRVTLKMYRDCSPGNAAFPGTVRIEVRDVNGNSFTPDKDIVIAFPGATPVQPYIDTCAANPGLCLEEAIYTSVVSNLPPQVGGYHLFYQYCCRNSTLDNVVNPLNTGESWYAFIPNNGALITNSSPVWTNPPPVFVCQGQPMNYDHGATDADGDSLVYSYYTPYDDNLPTFPAGVATFTPITWVGGFGPNNACGGPPLTMSSTTGFITGSPPFQGQFVCGVKCEEFRNGVKIGEILRDFQLNVVYCPPLAQASIGPSNDVCTGGTINFNNTSDPANSYYWDFGDGATTLDTSTFQFPTYTYPGLGPYLVTLIINYGTPCADTAYQTIDISSVTAITDPINGDSACVGQALIFNDSSTVTGNAVLTGFFWDFGDGNNDTASSVSHAYASSGTYIVTHIAQNSLGCDDTVYTTVYIIPPPIALAGNDTFACTNNPVIGLGGNVLNATGGTWIGPGAFNPDSMTFNATYTPTQTEIDSGYTILVLHTTGYTLCAHDYDTVRIDFVPGPVVDVGQDLFVCQDTPFIPICATVTIATGGMWNTTGSGTFTNPAQLCTDYYPSSADTAAGMVMLWMTSTGNGSCNAENDTLLLYFTPPPNVQAIGPDSACSNLPFSITAVTATGSGVWTSTGDGAFVNDTNLITSYTPGAGDITAGNVQIIFNSLNNGGCQQQRDTLNITIVPAPTSGLTYTPACPGYTMQFMDQTMSVTAIVSWFWDFGDPTSANNTSTLQNPSHVYTTGGWYNVTLITTSQTGCPDTVITPVYVYPDPVAAFTTNGICSNAPVDFIDASTVDSAGIVTWAWDFGDNGTATGNPATHLYGAAGSYNVTLIVSSNFGCLDTVTQTVALVGAPTAAFTSDPSPNANTYENVQFTDQSLIAGTIVSWDWDFGDSTNSTQQNPNHAWTAPGQYTVQLVVTDTNGCLDTTLFDYIISSPPVVPSGFSPNNDGENDIFFVLGGPFTELELRIYNKWGELIFTSTSQARGWDGTRDGLPQPEGVYVYTVHAITPDNATHYLEGDVTLVR